MKSRSRKKRTQAQFSVATSGDNAPVAKEILVGVPEIIEVLDWVKQYFLVSTKLVTKSRALLVVRCHGISCLSSCWGCVVFAFGHVFFRARRQRGEVGLCHQAGRTGKLFVTRSVIDPGPLERHEAVAAEREVSHEGELIQVPGGCNVEHHIGATIEVLFDALPIGPGAEAIE